MDGQVYWLWLSQIRGIGNTIGKKLLAYFKEPEAIYHADKDDLLAVPGVGKNIAEFILQNRSLKAAEDIMLKMTKSKVKLLTIADALYPERVKAIPDTPIVLYYKGRIDENSMGVAVVGARRCTEYGKRVAKEAAEYLAEHNIPVISGMAKGIDGYAHTACIKARGTTFAFLGHGLDLCYPVEHRDLMAAIITNGAVISEYPPGIAVKQAHFPRRNFLIGAWCHKLLVAEAGANSGSLITAEAAKKLGKEVLAVPNSIYKSESCGTNRLIADGAQLYLEPAQLLDKKEAISENRNSNNAIPKQCNSFAVRKEIGSSRDPLEKEVLAVLRNGALTTEQLVASFPGERNILAILSTMELEGKLQRLPGGKLVVKGRNSRIS